jgi:hypothetical protein
MDQFLTTETLIIELLLIASIVAIVVRRLQFLTRWRWSLLTITDHTIATDSRN